MRKHKKVVLLLLLLLCTFLLTGCGGSTDKPIEGFHGLWDIFVYPMAGIMWVIGKTIGFGNYALTIIFATLVVRSLAWPIYAKTNDMQLKMQLVQPEIDKIQKRYAQKQDRESQQRMQMEMMQVYKKYGIGFSGCLMPLIQMPIFIGFYRAISGIPKSITENNWIGKIFKDTKLFGVDMILKQNEAIDKATGEIIQSTGWTTQRWGVLILAILVGVTQIVSMIISNRRQKKQKEDQQSNVPMYRRPEQNSQQKTTEMTMKFMLYFMAAMMVVFVWTSPAGLGVYWVVGNIYSTFQTWIGHVSSQKRLEKLKKKHNR